MKRLVYYLCFGFLICLNKTYSQDSVANYSKLPWISVKAMPFPILYGAGVGYTLNGLIEKRIGLKNSFCFGAKYLYFSDFGGFLDGTNKLILLEYKHYTKIKDQDLTYLSPYLKLRNLRYHEYASGGYHKVYNETSLGIGGTYGHTFHLDKKGKIEINTFYGLGYFIKLDSDNIGTLRTSINVVPSSIYTRFDLRLGVLFGFNIH